MKPGAISIKKLLTDRNFVISDDKADKEVVLTHDPLSLPDLKDGVSRAK